MITRQQAFSLAAPPLGVVSRARETVAEQTIMLHTRTMPGRPARRARQLGAALDPSRLAEALDAARELAATADPSDPIARFRVCREIMAADLWAVGRSTKALAEAWGVPHSTVKVSANAASHSLRVDAAPAHLGVAHALETVEEAAEASRALAAQLCEVAATGEPREVLALAQAYSAASGRRLEAAEVLLRIGGLRPEETRPVSTDDTERDDASELDSMTLEELEAMRTLELGRQRRAN